MTDNNVNFDTCHSRLPLRPAVKDRTLFILLMRCHPSADLPFHWLHVLSEPTLSHRSRTASTSRHHTENHAVLSGVRTEF